MVSLYDRPEKYAANPPATWTVARLGRDRFAVIIEPVGLPADTHNTRADAQRVIDRPDSWLRRRYEKEAAAVLDGDRAGVLS